MGTIPEAETFLKVNISQRGIKTIWMLSFIEIHCQRFRYPADKHADNQSINQSMIYLALKRMALAGFVNKQH